MQKEEYQILITKGKEYTQDGDDRLKNFKVLAEELGIDPLIVWFIYFKKHIDSIASYIKHGRVVFSDENIEGRFADARNYLVLGRGIIDDTAPPIQAQKVRRTINE